MGACVVGDGGGGGEANTPAIACSSLLADGEELLSRILFAQTGLCSRGYGLVLGRGDVVDVRLVLAFRS